MSKDKCHTLQMQEKDAHGKCQSEADWFVIPFQPPWGAPEVHGINVH
jgi:hypothetical protein